MTTRRTLLTVAGIVGLFVALVATIVLLAAFGIVTFPAAILMLVALLGMYVGFGFLIAVYHFVAKLT
jgi:hypothetical protein